MMDQRLLKEGKRYKRQLTAVIALGVLAACGAILQAYLITAIVQAGFLDGKGLSDIIAPAAVLILVVLVRAVILWAGETAAYSLAAKVKQNLRHRLLDHLFTLGPVFVVQEQSGELINTLTEGIENLENYFAKFMPGVVMAGLVPAILWLVILPLDWMSALLMMLTAPLIPIFMVLIGKWADKLNKEQWETLSLLSAHLLDVLQGLTTLKIFGRSREQVQVIARLSDEFRSKTLSVLRVAFLSALVLELVGTISTALIAVTVGLKLLYGKMLFTQAFFILLLAPEFYAPLRQLGSYFHSAMSGISSAERIFNLLAVPLPAVITRDEPLPFSRKVTIEFQAVSFAYGEQTTVSNISFVIKPGEKLALVGPSGSGKSTLSRLLLQFVQASSGQILINGRRIDRIRLSDWRAHISYVPQLPHLFYGTIADNICFGLSKNRTEVIAACKQAQAHEFITQMSLGYDTLIGEGGQPLSGGQAQRIALARAFLKDAPVLILDEATAGLDLATEDVLQQTWIKLMRNRTVLFISHRLSTVCQADHIVVLSNGKISEQGSHEELLALGKEYAQLTMAYRGAQ